MASFNRYSSSQNYAPSAPSLPDNYSQQSFSPPPPPTPTSAPPHHHPSSFSQNFDAHHGQPTYGYSSSSHGYPSISVGAHFPPGTDPEIVTSFGMVDKDGSGFIDDKELQEALSFRYNKFCIATVRLLMFQFKNPSEQLQIGPNEFAALWDCLRQWRGIFERFDRDRSGKIDSTELRDALYSLGYLVPPSVLQVIISRYGGELNFDSFVECGMIVKGLTEKFKEKDPRYTGSATLSYDTFMSMVIPFIVP